MSLTVVYILVAILLFGLLVLVHEFGHFLTAKLSGVQVNEFSLFMGPAIWKRQKGETLYSLRCIPVGGYCAMEGEDGDSDNPRAFGRAKVWKRLLILVAGSFMNLVAGLLIMTIYVASVYQAIPTRAVASVDSDSVFAGQLQAGDSFYSIGGCTAAGLLVIQTILNCLGTVDILPFTGVTFPFLSNGGTSMIGAWGLLAFVKAADTRQNASFAIRLQKKEKED